MVEYGTMKRITINPQPDERIEFPLRLIFDGKTERYSNESDLCANLEEFNEADDSYVALDAKGIRLRIIMFELAVRVLRPQQGRLRTYLLWKFAQGGYKRAMLELEGETVVRAVLYPVHGRARSLPRHWSEEATVVFPDERMEQVISKAEFETAWAM